MIADDGEKIHSLPAYMRGMTANQISPQATAAREAARDNGRFGEQAHTGPEVSLGLHQTLMAEGATRVMPVARTTSNPWYEDEALDLAGELSERHNAQGMVTRVVLPEGTEDPAARYIVTLRSAHTGDSGRTFVYESGDQFFEEQTPTIAEVLTEAAHRANVERGQVTEDGDMTSLDNLIAVLGEHDARELLADSYVRGGTLTYN